MVLVVAVRAVMVRPEPTALHSMVSGSSSAPTGPQPRGRPRPAHRHMHRLRAALGPSGRACGRDDGWILVTVVSTSRLPVVAEMSRAPDLSQLRLPAPGEQRASRQQNRRGGAFARADGERKLRRAEAGAPRHARSWSRRGSGRRACACAPAACAPVSRARALRQGRPKAARCMRGCR